jgi:Bacterial Ig domain/PKD domain
VLVGSNFALDHNYLDSGLYFAKAKVMDQRGRIGVAGFKVTVQNLAATVQAGTHLVASEGGIVSILGSFANPGLLDTHTATIDWGDGTPAQSMRVHEADGAGTVFASHAYADENVYGVTVTVTDNHGASSSDTLTVTVTVSNVVPRVDAGLDRAISAGELVALPARFATEVFDVSSGAYSFQTVAGSFVDPGALDSHAATIDWGDGTVEAVPLQERTFSSQNSPSRTIGSVESTHRYSSSGNFIVLITVSDDDGGTGSDSFMVTVSANQANNPPTANDDQDTTDEDMSVTIPILANDSFAPDVDEILSITEISQPGHGAAVINPEGTITYTPDANFFGSDNFTYTISDGHEGTATASVTITVTPVNDAPAAGGDSTSTAEGIPITIAVLANDSDLDGTLDATTVAIVAAASHGTTSVNPTTGAITYTPAPHYAGPDSFTYKVKDNSGADSNAAATRDRRLRAERGEPDPGMVESGLHWPLPARRWIGSTRITRFVPLATARIRLNDAGSVRYRTLCVHQWYNDARSRKVASE